MKGVAILYHDLNGWSSMIKPGIIGPFSSTRYDRTAGIETKIVGQVLKDSESVKSLRKWLKALWIPLN